MAAEFIRVSARVRPSGNISSSREVLILDKANVAIGSSNSKFYQFDQIFDKDADQETVFKDVGKRIIDGALEGINGTVFAYGQTGSGKTHTMLGPAQEEDFFNDAHQKGLMPRCFEYLFQQLDLIKSKKEIPFEYTVSCTFVELYNEGITDLLTDSCPPVTIRAEGKNVVLQGATCENIATFLEAMQLLRIGWNNRRVGETAMNKESSRSHAVLTIDVVQTEDDGGVINKQEARINLVDLAGSERQSQTKACGVRLKEAGKINQSLGTLGRVIRKLSAKGGHVPYRDSKLTLMIRDSLGGNCRTAVIVCVHPDEDYYVESLSTLNFAEHCRLVKNEFHVNREITGKSVAALQAKVAELRNLLENVNKETIQEYEDRIRKTEEERDSYKQRLRDQDSKDVDDTIAMYSPNITQNLRTPAQTKQRRRTRFNTPGQRSHLEATRATQLPFWGDEDDKENEAQDLSSLTELLRTKQDDIQKLQTEKDELESAVSSHLIVIDQLTSAKNTLESEKATLERDLLKEQELRQKLQTDCDDLEVELEYRQNNLTALEEKLRQTEEDFNSAKQKIETMAGELKELTGTLSQKEILLTDKDMQIKEYQKAGKHLAVKMDQKNNLLEDAQKENHRLTELLAETTIKLTEKEHLVKLVQDENCRLLKGKSNRQTLEKEMEKHRAAIETSEQQMFDLREENVALETQIELLKDEQVERDEQIATLKKENEELIRQVSEVTGHKNNRQNIRLMERYSKDLASAREEIQQLRSKLDRQERAKLRES